MGPVVFGLLTLVFHVKHVLPLNYGRMQPILPMVSYPIITKWPPIIFHKYHKAPVLPWKFPNYGQAFLAPRRVAPPFPVDPYFGQTFLGSERARLGIRPRAIFERIADRVNRQGEFLTNRLDAASNALNSMGLNRQSNMMERRAELVSNSFNRQASRLENFANRAGEFRSMRGRGAHRMERQAEMVADAFNRQGSRIESFANRAGDFGPMRGGGANRMQNQAEMVADALNRRGSRMENFANRAGDFGPMRGGGANRMQNQAEMVADALNRQGSRIESFANRAGDFGPMRGGGANSMQNQAEMVADALNRRGSRIESFANRAGDFGPMRGGGANRMERQAEMVSDALNRRGSRIESFANRAGEFHNAPRGLRNSIISLSRNRAEAGISVAAGGPPLLAPAISPGVGQSLGGAVGDAMNVGPGAAVSPVLGNQGAVGAAPVGDPQGSPGLAVDISYGPEPSRNAANPMNGLTNAAQNRQGIEFNRPF